MSEWFEVKDKDNVELSDDGKFVDIMFDTNDFGNRYVEVPVGMLVKLLATERAAWVNDAGDADWDCAHARKYRLPSGRLFCPDCQDYI